MRLTVLLFFISIVLNAGEKEIVMAEEFSLYTLSYQRISHQMYEIKKMQEELSHLHKNIAKVKADSIIKEQQANAMLEQMSDLPLIELYVLKQQSLSIQTEQLINSLEFDFGSLETNDIAEVMND